MPLRPMLAVDAVIEKIKYPCIVMPKYDGVRATVQDEILLGRSLKRIPNKYCHKLFDTNECESLDAELVVGSPTDTNCIQHTTSGVMSIGGEPDVTMHCFDLLYDGTHRPYHLRLSLVKTRIKVMELPYLKVIPSYTVESLERLLSIEKTLLDQGYEGLIVRDPFAMYKHGRSTVREGGLLRIKRFSDSEAEIIRIEEGQTNLNEATTNELGLTERATKQEFMLPSGMLGTIIGIDLHSGEEVNISPGKMTADEKRYFMAHPDKILGRISKYKFFAVGIKDKPRFPTHQTFRAKEDL